jgi:4-diphosphocytidyl-2-C-methyl-D-erythritol kinase
VSPPPIRVLAPAKLNLGLEILSRRDDGYHEIDSLMLPLDLADELRIETTPEPGITLDCDSPELPAGRANLAVRAAERVCEQLGITPRLHLRLSKRIPVAAGLGGGSSDAAAVILGLEALFERHIDTFERSRLALELGADVPFFLEPAPARATGLGERLEPLVDLPEMHWLLVAFPFGISTAEAYRTASAELTLPRQGSSIAALLGPGGRLASPHNDLEGVAARRHPEIPAARKALERAGAQITGMSGSGPTVYGRFATAALADRASEASAGRELPPGVRTIRARSPRSGERDWGWGVAKW